MQEQIDRAKKLYHRGLITKLDYYQRLLNIALLYDLDTIEEIPLHCVADIIETMETIDQLEDYIQQLEAIIEEQLAD